jgi:uncharacterized protein
MKIAVPTVAFGLLLALLAPPFADAAAPKRILVVTTTEGFRHSSIVPGEKALADMDEATPDFEIAGWLRQPDVTVPRKPSKPQPLAAEASEEERAKQAERVARYEQEIKDWTPEKEAEATRLREELRAALAEALKPLAPEALRAERIDGVVFLNTSGNLPLPDLQGFVRWIGEGNAFIGAHAASDTLKSEPLYTGMLGGIFDGHGPQVEALLHAGEGSHVACAGLGETWKLPLEEMYLFRDHDPASVRTVWFMKHHPNHPEQAGHFPVSWSREEGKGRVFYTAIGHRDDLWSLDPAMPGRVNPVETALQFRQHLLGGLRWALGLADAGARPAGVVP